MRSSCRGSAPAAGRPAARDQGCSATRSIRTAIVSSRRHATGGWASTNERNSQEDSARQRRSLVAVTVAVRGLSEKSAISPKWSPAPSVPRCSPASVTAASPSTTTKNASTRAPALALPDDGRAGLEDELAEELGDLPQLWLRKSLEDGDPREHVDAIGRHRHGILEPERARRTRDGAGSLRCTDGRRLVLPRQHGRRAARAGLRSDAGAGGGSVAAIAVALAAGLATMAARFSVEHWDGAAGAVAQGETLRKRAAPLADEDAAAYEQALDALRAPRTGDPEARDREIGDALARAADVPLRIAEIATDVAELAAEVAERGNENLRGDAAAAAVLAEAGARMAANLVVINLTMREEDARVQRALWLADAAARAAHRAVAATS